MRTTTREAEGSPGLMTTAAWITMIAIMAFVWGGLATAVRTAVRKESVKNADH